jgi:predicted DNA-binding protein with PD1-like motif
VDLAGPFEIVSLTGTLACSGDGDSCVKHLHISLSDAQGRVVGGHLVRLEVETTAEIVVGELEDLVFTREHDANTGFAELVVSRR